MQDDQADAAPRASIWTRLSWALGAAAVAVVVVVAARSSETRELLRLLREIRPGWVAAAAVLQAATYACDASIWRRVLARAAAPQPFGRMCRLSIARLFVGQALPSGGLSGDLLVVRALSRYGVASDVSTTALLLNLFGFYAAFAGCALLAAIVFYASGTLSGPILGIAIPFSVLVVGIPGLIAWLVRSERSARRTFWRRVPLLGRMLETLGRARPELLRDRRLLGLAVGLQTATFALDAGTLLVMLMALGVRASIAPDAFAAFVLASAAELVGPVPGGLGAFEGGCIVGLHAFGVPVETALLATLLLRGFTFWLPMVPGFFVARWAVAGKRR